jgi:predicted nucleic acid-binding protein
MFDSNDHPVKTQPFWDAVDRGEIRVVFSDILENEVKPAPRRVREFYAKIPITQIERVVSTSASDTLAERYIKAGILTQNHFTDCKHVALATLAGVDALVSWNTKHIVNDNKIRLFNAVSIGFGCDKIKILLPNNLTLRGR